MVRQQGCRTRQMQRAQCRSRLVFSCTTSARHEEGLCSAKWAVCTFMLYLPVERHLDNRCHSGQAARQGLDKAEERVTGCMGCQQRWP